MNPTARQERTVSAGTVARPRPAYLTWQLPVGRAASMR